VSKKSSIFCNFDPLANGLVSGLSHGVHIAKNVFKKRQKAEKSGKNSKTSSFSENSLIAAGAYASTSIDRSQR
jgi:hypothetical protein